MRGRCGRQRGQCSCCPRCWGAAAPRSPAPPPYYADLAALTQQLDDDNTAADEALGEELEDAWPAEVGDLFSRVTIEGADRLDGVLDEVSSLSHRRRRGRRTRSCSTRRRDGHRGPGDRRAMAGLSRTSSATWPSRPAYVAAEERVDRACPGCRRSPTRPVPT